MADASLDEYIQQKGIGLSKKMKPSHAGLDRPFKRQNVTSVASEHDLQAKKPFDAREKLRTFQGANKGAEDARLKLINKNISADVMGNRMPQVHDARARLIAKQNKHEMEFDLKGGCEVVLENKNFQLASIKKALIKGTEPQPSNMGWSLVKTVTNDVSTTLVQQQKATPCVSHFPTQAVGKTVINRKVSQFNAGNNKNTEKVQPEDKGSGQEFVSSIQSFRVIVSNLGPKVTYDDVEELFSSCGPLRKVKMSKPGSAEIFYVNIESAYDAVEEYHNRELDDRPMSVVMSLLQDVTKLNETRPLRSKKQMSALKQSVELDPLVLSHALFRANADQASNAVDFTVHL